jgi:anthranilate phosphoribosyltransferase
MIDPRRYGLGHPPEERGEVLGGSALDNANILQSVLAAQRGPAHDMVVLNAGAALVVAEAAPGLEAGIERARDLIDQGHALAKLKQFVSFTRRR